MVRKALPKDVEQRVLVESRRRCCVCFGLHRDLRVKSGQIAHLDGDNSNNRIENLAFFCFDHHDQYDSRTSQSKNLTALEVKTYRKELQSSVLRAVPSLIESPNSTPPRDDGGGFTTFSRHKEEENLTALLELLAENGSPQFGASTMARILNLRPRTVERLLFILSESGKVRIDRRPGTTKKVYSLTSSIENRLIDAFVASLGDDVVLDQRYLRKNRFELDAHVTTKSGSFAVETVRRVDHVSSGLLERKISRLKDATEALRLTDADHVLLVAVSEESDRGSLDLGPVENQGIILRFVDFD